MTTRTVRFHGPAATAGGHGPRPRSAPALRRLGAPLLLALALPAGLSAQAWSFEPAAWEGSWFRGNTHAHTTESDGDSAPEVVVRWYRDHGYHFLVLSDHNV
ncbi:MAG TPA: hypothetical protein VMK65_00035, partial [Longimicrobiales bacterium]|nr:hypothetical protein [Longimicrobiales bacterium]